MIPNKIGHLTDKSIDCAYLEDLKAVVSGNPKTSRTGVNTRSLFGTMHRIDLTDGKLPILASKEIVTRSILHELIWMISGSTNIRYLKENNVSIWDSWVDPRTIERDHEGNLTAGDIGPGYGKQWRDWTDHRIVTLPDDNTLAELEQLGYTKYADLPSNEVLYTRKIDQLSNVIHTLKTNPDDRRMIVSAWNVGALDQMQLPPCHMLFHFYTRLLTKEELIGQLNQTGVTVESSTDYLAMTDDELLSITANHKLPLRKLSCLMYQRSVDSPLGKPFNLTQYAVLTHMIAADVNMLAEDLLWVGGDTHIYENQMDGVEQHLSRMGEGTDPFQDSDPRIVLKEHKSLFDYTFDDIEITGYNPLPRIFMPISV